MTLRTSDLRQYARDVRPDGWRLTLTVERSRPDVPPMVVLRTFSAANERGSQVRVRQDELVDLEDAIAICRSWAQTPATPNPHPSNGGHDQ